MNRTFGKPVVQARTGGRRGGSTKLTSIGLAIVSRYRAIELAASLAAEDHIAALQDEIEAKEP